MGQNYPVRHAKYYSSHNKYTSFCFFTFFFKERRCPWYLILKGLIFFYFTLVWKSKHVPRSRRGDWIPLFLLVIVSMIRLHCALSRLVLIA